MAWKLAATTDEIIQFKLDRLRLEPGAKPRVLDLFSGCGGLSLGFQAAGADIVAAVDNDPHAAASHAHNFHNGLPLALKERHGRPRDITEIDPDELAIDLELGPPGLAIDIIVGGPPCQAYARVGRAKLREVAEHPEAYKVDPRANLYLRYLYYVRELTPLAVLMENVPDILNHGGHNIGQEIVEALDGLGYVARYSLINSAHHGVPQMRDRVFLIGFRKELDVEVTFPEASHYHQLPSGYAGTRAVALRLINMFSGSGYAAPDVGNPDLPPAVTAREAIGDLPSVTDHLEGKLRRGTRRFTTLAPYEVGSLSDYAMRMRTWPEFSGGEGVYDHVLRYLPRDSVIFRAMRQGDEYPAAFKVAERLFLEEANRRGLDSNCEDWEHLRRQMVPPYDPGKFPNRWWKLIADAPVRTLTAHIGKDTYSHIHYDDAQARVITVREAARLQSFPDGFFFCGTMNPAFRQIGNSVPPLMALAIAKPMIQTLTHRVRRSTPDASLLATVR